MRVVVQNAVQIFGVLEENDDYNVSPLLAVAVVKVISVYKNKHSLHNIIMLATEEVKVKGCLHEQLFITQYLYAGNSRSQC